MSLVFIVHDLIHVVFHKRLLVTHNSSLHSVCLSDEFFREINFATHMHFLSPQTFFEKTNFCIKNVWFFWSNNLNKFKTLKQWLHLLSLIMRLPIQKMPKPELSSSSLSWNQDYWIFLDSNLQIALFFMLLSISPTCLD